MSKKKSAKRLKPLQHSMRPKHSFRKPWTKQRIITLSSVGVAIFAFLAYGVFLGSQVLKVKEDLESVQLAAGTIKQQLQDKDIAGLEQSLITAELATADARRRSDTLAWKAVEWIPVLGENMRAVRVVSVQADLLLKNLALPVVKVLPADGQLPLGADGNIDFSFIDRIQPIVNGSAKELTVAKKELEAVNSPSLVPQISSALVKFQEIADLAAPLPETMKVFRATLGMDKPITIALVAQNNAEAAALGGNSASITLLRIDRGEVSIDRTITQRELPLLAVESSVPQETIDLHSDIMLIWANAATFRPDFPTTAELLNAHLERDLGVSPDAYISIDPLALARIVGATGPITLPSGDVLTSKNTVSLLLNEIYFRYSEGDTSGETDRFFSAAATGILTAVKSGRFNIGKMLNAITDGVNQGSVMAWYKDPELQRSISSTALSGQLPKSNKDKTTVGVFFRDNSSSKIDYYLQTQTKLVSDQCGGSGTATVEVTLHSMLTDAQAQTLPSYVQAGAYGWEYFQTKVFIYAPIGAQFDNIEIVQSSKIAQLEAQGTDLNRRVAKFTVDLRPGETAVMRATLTGATKPAGPWSLRTTPMIHGTSSTTPAKCH